MGRLSSPLQAEAPRQLVAFSPGLPLLLGLLQAVGPLSIDMYLPAFPNIDADFHVAAGGAQFTLATWILGLSIGQIGQGVLADRFGRRPPLIAGALLYTLASAGCALAPSLAALAVWRFVAAIGASASMIVPRAIVRDVASGHDAARLMARLILILGAAPILAPSLGGLVLQVAHWRVIFWIMTFYGAIALGLSLAFLPDTLPVHARVHAGAAAIFGRYGRILRERGFLTHALLLSAMVFALFSYLGGTPEAFITRYHLSPGWFAIAFGGVAACYIGASQANILLVRAIGLDRTLHLATALYVAATAGVLAIALIDRRSVHLGPWVFALALGGAQALTGLVGPTATVGALHRHAAHAGSASAMLGTLQFLIGAVGGFLIGALTDGTAVPMAALMLAGAVAMKIADLARPAGSKEGLLF